MAMCLSCAKMRLQSCGSTAKASCRLSWLKRHMMVFCQHSSQMDCATHPESCQPRLKH